MGIIVTKTDKDTELTARISADLRARAQAAKDIDDPDLVEDSDYAKDLKKTGKFGWVWIVLIVAALIALAAIIIF